MLENGEGRCLLDEAHGVLVATLLASQADELSGHGRLAGALVRSDWDGSVARSFDAVAACYRSWDGGDGSAEGEWCEVEVLGTPG